MPKKQSTAAQKARRHQASTGQTYTAALRAQGPAPTIRHRAFSADGAGWAPIIERAKQQAARIAPAIILSGSEKFGALGWDNGAVPEAVRPLLRQATLEAAVTCQTCPSPGRKRVVCTWADGYGYVMPWVKTCCDACYYAPPSLRHTREYLDLVERYELPSQDEAEPLPPADADAIAHTGQT